MRILASGVDVGDHRLPRSASPALRGGMSLAQELLLAQCQFQDHGSVRLWLSTGFPAGFSRLPQAGPVLQQRVGMILGVKSGRCKERFLWDGEDIWGTLGMVTGTGFFSSLLVGASPVRCRQGAQILSR